MQSQNTHGREETLAGSLGVHPGESWTGGRVYFKHSTQEDSTFEEREGDPCDQLWTRRRVSYQRSESPVKSLTRGEGTAGTDSWAWNPIWWPFPCPFSQWIIRTLLALWWGVLYLVYGFQRASVCVSPPFSRDIHPFLMIHLLLLLSILTSNHFKHFQQQQQQQLISCHSCDKLCNFHGRQTTDILERNVGRKTLCGKKLCEKRYVAGEKNCKCFVRTASNCPPFLQNIKACISRWDGQQRLYSTMWKSKSWPKDVSALFDECHFR